jgi:hypothetical protein
MSLSNRATTASWVSPQSVETFFFFAYSLVPTVAGKDPRERHETPPRKATATEGERAGEFGGLERMGDGYAY